MKERWPRKGSPIQSSQYLLVKREGWDSFSEYTCASRPWTGFPHGKKPVINGPRTPFVHSRTPLLTPRCLSPPTKQHICFSKYTLAHRRREGKIAVKRNAVSELPVPPRQSEGWDSVSKYTCASRPWNGFPHGNPVKLWTENPFRSFTHTITDTSLSVTAHSTAHMLFQVHASSSWP